MIYVYVYIYLYVYNILCVHIRVYILWCFVVSEPHAPWQCLPACPLLSSTLAEEPESARSDLDPEQGAALVFITLAARVTTPTTKTYDL